MNKIIDSTVGELGKTAFDWFLMTFFGEYYVKYLTRQLVLKGVAEAEAEKQLKQFVNNPSPMAAFIQAENEIEYRNMFKTLIKALPKITKGCPKNNEVDFDVMKRLKDISKDFSSEDMQELVSSILAGEYNQPGTFSIKTIDVVRSLSKKDLELFQRFGCIIINNEFYFKEWYNSGNNTYEILNGQGLSLTDIMELQGMGLVFDNDIVKEGKNIDGEQLFLATIQGKTIPFKKNGKLVLRGLATLTRAGREILPLLPQLENNILFELVKKEFINKGFNI